MLSKFVWILASIRISGFLFGTGQGFSEECNSRMVARIAFLRRLLKYAVLLKSQSLKGNCLSTWCFGHGSTSFTVLNSFPSHLIGMGRQERSPSTIDRNSSHPSLCHAAFPQEREEDLSTELKLGLSISKSTTPQYSSHITKKDLPSSDWPPLKTLLRTVVTKKHTCRTPKTFFIKVYMEEIPIGRKVDLYAVDGYIALTHKLCSMFRALIVSSDLVRITLEKRYLLTYKDNKGDWMMVGVVPWE
ncbi:hypothetical protein HPP92_016441 [Vanilla planifolia]|uniref:Auxin-responsive protein n=1 Tax=Vanilla planifolia TaxID=51239 RepID=A0A835QKC8_VANPL|nr:hypothetical protein HPP92_016968 [Vanilla planifolia]KAG0471895.1 hypothetical protein HPP92_016441 [Vanilla planifolia]